MALQPPQSDLGPLGIRQDFRLRSHRSAKLAGLSLRVHRWMLLRHEMTENASDVVLTNLASPSSRMSAMTSGAETCAHCKFVRRRRRPQASSDAKQTESSRESKYVLACPSPCATRSCYAQASTSTCNLRSTGQCVVTSARTRHVTDLRLSLHWMISVWSPTSSSTGTWPLRDVFDTRCPS